MRQPDVKWEAVKNRGWRLDYGAAAPQGRVLSGQMAESRCWTDSGKSGKRGAHMSLKCIGIDIGGTSVKLGIFEEDGTLVKKWEIPTAAKDQTYALYNLTQFQLSKTLMPIGDYAKDEVRKIAEDRGLTVAKKKDSMEICFVPDNDYAGFIEREAESVPESGNFVDKNGVILGKHKGITHYTVGQRKGLNLAMGHPVFVTGIRPETNEVVIGEGNDVFSDHLICRDVNWMAIDGLHGAEKEVLAKIRYSHKGSPCIIRELPDGTVECRFKEPQRAITPGQAVVFYEDECVVGGGTIL